MSQETPYSKVNIVDAQGNLVTFGQSTGGSFGDASAANQQVEITRLEQVRDRLPPTLEGDRLKVDLPLTAATDASLQQIIANLPSATKPSLVRSTLKKWREEFNGSALEATAWEIVQTGSGQSITVTNSELRITAGMTANSETIIKGLIPFTIPFRVQFQYFLSSRSNTQEYYLEIVDATGNNKASIIIDNFYSSSNGARLVTTNEGVAGAIISNNNFLSSNSYSIFDLEVGDDEINLYSKSSDSANGRINTALTLTRKLPDPNLQYYIQLRVKNLGVTPTFNAILHLDSILVTDHEELSAEIVSARGGNANSAMPVFFPSTLFVNIGNSPTINSISNTVNTISASTKDFTSNTTVNVPLAANATYISSSTSISSLNKIRGWIFSDQSGTLFVDFSISGSNWRTVQTINYTANNVMIFEQVLSGLLYRVRYTNGATAQAIFELLFTQFGIGA